MNKEKNITLTIGEIDSAIAVGTLREKESIKRNLPTNYLGDIYDRKGWFAHIEGAGSELAVCKYRNI